MTNTTKTVLTAGAFVTVIALGYVAFPARKDAPARLFDRTETTATSSAWDRAGDGSFVADPLPLLATDTTQPLRPAPTQVVTFPPPNLRIRWSTVAMAPSDLIVDEDVLLIAWSGTIKRQTRKRYTGPLDRLTFVSVHRRGPMRAEVKAAGRTWQMVNAATPDGLGGTDAQMGIEP